MFQSSLVPVGTRGAVGTGSNKDSHPGFQPQAKIGQGFIFKRCNQSSLNGQKA